MHIRRHSGPILAALAGLALLVGPGVQPAAAAPSASFTIEQCYSGTGNFPPPPDPYTVQFRTTITGLEPFTPVAARITFAGHTLNAGFGSGSGTVATDIHTYTVPGTAIGTTATAVFFVDGVELTTIEITVTCAPVEPQASADCKDEGFEDFATLGFKNQGQCVRWVSSKKDKSN